jgi:hypothetical protein
LIGAVIFFFLLVGALFGVSIAVAILTKETTVSNGALYTKDGSAVVATDSHAEVFGVDLYDFGACISVEHVETIKAHVQDGKNVVLQKNSEDGTNHELEVLSPSGATYNEETGVACFRTPEDSSKVFCLLPDSGSCNQPENHGRVLARCNGNNVNHSHCAPPATVCQCGTRQECATSTSCSLCVQHEGSLTCPEEFTEENNVCSCDSSSWVLCMWEKSERCRSVEDCSNCAS